MELRPQPTAVFFVLRNFLICLFFFSEFVLEMLARRNLKFSANISSLFMDIPDHIESYREILNRFVRVCFAKFFKKN